VRASFVASLLLSLIWIWSGDLVIERKGFLSLALIFNASVGFHLAKLARDLKDKKKAQELRPQAAFKTMVVISSALSLIVPLVAICLMPLEPQQRLFLLVGHGGTCS